MECSQVVRALNIKYVNALYRVNNVYFFGNSYGETDFLVVQQSKLIFDVEIKISRSDFFADFKKFTKHQILSKQIPAKYLPNKFYYAVPKNLITPDEIPTYSGLIYVDELGHAEEVVPAPMLHKEKLEFRTRLCDKFYYAYRELLTYKENDGVGQLKKQISDLKRTLEQAHKNNREMSIELRTIERNNNLKTL